MKLNLGCGMDKMKGYVNVDNDPLVQPDVIADFDSDKLPFDTGSIEEIYASHLLEHIRKLGSFLEECHRVLKPDGLMRIRVPFYLHESSFADPEHVWHLPPAFFGYLSRRCKGSDGRPVVCGNFDFEVVGISNSESETGVVLRAMKPVRIIESDKPATYLKLEK